MKMDQKYWLIIFNNNVSWLNNQSLKLWTDSIELTKNVRTAIWKEKGSTFSNKSKLWKDKCIKSRLDQYC